MGTTYVQCRNDLYYNECFWFGKKLKSYIFTLGTEFFGFVESGGIEESARSKFYEDMEKVGVKILYGYVDNKCMPLIWEGAVKGYTFGVKWKEKPPIPDLYEYCIDSIDLIGDYNYIVYDHKFDVDKIRRYIESEEMYHALKAFYNGLSKIKIMNRIMKQAPHIMNIRSGDIRLVREI